MNLGSSHLEIILSRDNISPLEDDDSLILSPFTPCEANGDVLASNNANMAPLSNGSNTTKNNKSGRVTLVLPWLTDPSDRCMLYGPSDEKEKLPMFEDQVEQEAFIRSWLVDEANMPQEAGDLNIL